MTLNGHYALYYITCLSFGAHHKNLNADRPILSAAKISPVNVASSDIRVMQIFAGVRDVKQESGRLRCTISLHNAVVCLP